MSDLPVTFQFQPLEDLEIVKATPKAKKKANAALAEAQIFAKFGVHALRVKARVLAALGKEADEAGIRHIGHGKIIVASDNAESAIKKLGDIAVDVLSTPQSEESPAPDYKLVLDIMRLQKEFNQQIINTAQVHLEGSRPDPKEKEGNSLSVPYPSGSPVMIAIGKQNPEA